MKLRSNSLLQASAFHVTLIALAAILLGVGAAPAQREPSASWTEAGRLVTGRYGQTATLLPSGKVLVAGGFGNSGFTASAELYDPATGRWTATGSLAEAHYGHTATLLPSG